MENDRGCQITLTDLVTVMGVNMTNVVMMRV